ncbi:MAG: hypothetical protein ACMXYG_01985 [Candidatus Woesearchaeota archaeon]
MSEQQIISFLKQNGPSTPAQFGKFMGITQLFASAMLGELSSTKKIKISALKIGGGSPLYYLIEDQEKLQNFANNLNSKDRQAYDLLKEKKVLRDSKQTPITRISLRAIKDFAVPLNIIRNNNKEIFWKWYLLSDKEAEQIIKSIFESENIGEINNNRQNNEINTSVDKEQKNEIKEEVKKQEVQEKQEALNENKQKIDNVTKTKNEDLKNKTKIIKSDSKITDFNNSEISDKNQEFLTICKTNFGKKVIEYFSNKNIKIIRYEQIKKNKEYSLITSVPSSIGESKYYCRIIDKKRITESELALSLIEGQHNKLPSLLVTNGELSKKAKEQKEIIFKDLSVINI